MRESLWDQEVTQDYRRGVNADPGRADRIARLVSDAVGITNEALIHLENRVNQFWTKHGIYMILSGTHMLQRFQRAEHTKDPVTLSDINRIFPRFTQIHGLSLVRQDPREEHYGVIIEPKTNINIGFVIRPGDGQSEYSRDIMLQTILRKKDFQTSDRIYKV